MTKSKRIKIIATLTSYPKRIKYTHQVINLLKKQTIVPDKIILYLAQDDFPKGVSQIPKNLQKLLIEKKLQVKFVNLDLKPHNKYFYAMQEYPNDLIITVDDDIQLPLTAIEELYTNWLDNKSAIIARRAHLITFNEDGSFQPYNSWIHEFDMVRGAPSMQLFATGCGGVLYPPHCFPSTAFDAESIKKTSLYADDVWLKIQELVNDLPVVVSSKAKKLQFIEDSQDYALINQNGTNKRNDHYWEKICAYIDNKYQKENYVYKLLSYPKIGINLLKCNNLFSIIRNLDIKQKNLEKKLKSNLVLQVFIILKRTILFPKKIYKKFYKRKFIN